MRIVVQRTIFSDKSSIGQLMIDGRFFCYTLEDTDWHVEDDPDAKIPGETAMPRGVFEAEMRKSPRFGWTLWIKGVPGYEWVLIHWGNKPEDTDGCILLGDAYADDWISYSRATFAKFMKKVEHAHNITVEVT